MALSTTKPVEMRSFYSGADTGGTSVLGIKIQPVYTLVVRVPPVPTVVANGQRTKNHEVLITASQGHSRDTGDGNQAAASGCCGGVQGVPVSASYLGTGETSVVCPNGGVEGVRRPHAAYREIDLGH